MDAQAVGGREDHLLGTTSEEAGKSAGMESGARSRTVPRADLDGGAGGISGSERSMAIAAPSPVATGDHSMPSPGVSSRQASHR